MEDSVDPSDHCVLIRLRFLKRRDPFCEENLPPEYFQYRWVELRNLIQADQGRPQWHIGLEPLEIGELPASGPIKEPSLENTAQDMPVTQTIMTTVIDQQDTNLTTRGDVSCNVVLYY